MSNEVDLIGDIVGCRACKWFWNEAPYGPYPSARIKVLSIPEFGATILTGEVHCNVIHL